MIRNEQTKASSEFFGMPRNIPGFNFFPDAKKGEETFFEKKVAQSRMDFARTENDANKTMGILAKMLPLRNTKVQDVSIAHEQYRADFLGFLNNEIKGLGSSKSNEAKEKGELVNFLTTSEKIELFETRTEVREETLGHKDAIKKIYLNFLKLHGKNEKDVAIRIDGSQKDWDQINGIYDRVSQSASPENEKHEFGLDSVMLDLLNELASGEKKNWNLVKGLEFDKVNQSETAKVLENARERCYQIIGENANPESGETIQHWMARMVKEAEKKKK